MLIGVPKEIKNHEYRVGLEPASVRELIFHGHKVMVETTAGHGIGVSDDEYRAAGADICDTAAQIWQNAELIIKVKEPQPDECRALRPGQTLFTYLHLAPDTVQTELLLASGGTAIAYETVTCPQIGLPLLAPMSQVAGRLSIQAGSHCLEKAQGGVGILLGGVPGVAPARVTIIGGGAVGTNAAQMAVGMGARVTILERSLNRLRQLNELFDNRLNTLYSTQDTLEHYVTQADLVVGAVLVPGAAAPKVVSHDLIKKMHRGAVVVDVAIDQGGCFETSRPTTHDDPTYEVDGVVHYCVTNMPGAVPRTSTYALNNATLPFIIELANKGPMQALRDNPHLRNGLNVHQGKLTIQAVAEVQGLAYTPAEDVL